MTEAKKPKKRTVKKKPAEAPQPGTSKLPGHVTAIDIQHALRASLLLDTADSRGQSTYSSLEVGIQIHIEGIPEGVDYKDVIAAYDAEAVKLVVERVNLDARVLGFRAFTDYNDDDAIEAGEVEEVSDSEL